ncbi:hypothetical protein Tco_1292926 [Tanacetum coccineum]
MPPTNLTPWAIARLARLARYQGRACMKRIINIGTDDVKYIKGHVKIHHIKQKEGESTKAFMERFKAESMHVNGAPKCMRVSGFMHGITNPNLIKRLNDNIPKSVDEMTSMTTAFLRREVVVANQSRKKATPTWKHHETLHKASFDKRPNFKNRENSSRRHDMLGINLHKS